MAGGQWWDPIMTTTVVGDRMLHSFFYKKLFEKKLSPVSFGLRLSKKFLKKLVS